jgi:hypothetical protein
MSLAVTAAGGGGGAPAVGPHITQVRVKGTKKLYVFGERFTRDSVIRLNGVSLSPKSFQGDASSGRLFFKGRLRLGAAGSNVLVVLNSGGTSQPYNF